MVKLKVLVFFCVACALFMRVDAVVYTLAAKDFDTSKSTALSITKSGTYQFGGNISLKLTSTCQEILNIAASGVTLDLKGFQLAINPPSNDDSSLQSVITVSAGAARVYLTNGTIKSTCAVSIGVDIADSQGDVGLSKLILQLPLTWAGVRADNCAQISLSNVTMSGLGRTRFENAAIYGVFAHKINSFEIDKLIMTSAGNNLAEMMCGIYAKACRETSISNTTITNLTSQGTIECISCDVGADLAISSCTLGSNVADGTTLVYGVHTQNITRLYLKSLTISKLYAGGGDTGLPAIVAGIMISDSVNPIVDTCSVRTISSQKYGSSYGVSFTKVDQGVCKNCTVSAVTGQMHAVDVQTAGCAYVAVSDLNA